MNREAVASVDTIEKLAVLMMEGFEEVYVRFDGVYARLDAIEVRLDRIEARLDEHDARFDRIEQELIDIHRRLDALEEQGARQAGYAKEIDHVLDRVRRIEKHIKLA